MSSNSSTTLSAAEWTGILYDLIIYESSGKYASDNNECPVNDIVDALMNALCIKLTGNYKKRLLSNPVVNYINENQLCTPDGITAYINTTRHHTFSIFPYPLTVGIKHNSHNVVGTNHKGVFKTEIVSLPKLSNGNLKDFLRVYHAIVPRRYHDGFATVIQHLRDNRWTHRGSGGRTRSLRCGLEGATKFSQKLKDKKRLFITHILPWELERRRAFARLREINDAIRQKQDFTRPDVQKPEQDRKQLQDEMNILEERLEAMRLEEVARLEQERQLKEKQEKKARAQRIASIAKYMTTLQTSLMSTNDNLNSVKDLHKALQNNLRHYTGRKNVEVHLFGSFKSGLAGMTSDADFTVYNFFSPNSGGNSITDLANALRWAGCQCITTIANARVPIVSFTAWNFQCDMSTDQPMGVINSKLIATYRSIDIRFPTLWFSIRGIAKKYEILSGSTGYLSSYALTMMLIVFLQDVCKPPILPRLQQQNGRRMQKRMVDGYDCSFDRSSQRFRSANITTVGQLLIDFCRFYGHTFKYATEEVNPCLGVVKSRSFSPPPRSQTDRRPKDWAMCVLDPFITDRNVAGNSRKFHVAKIQKCFQDAFGALDVGDLDKAFKQ